MYIVLQGTALFAAQGQSSVCVPDAAAELPAVLEMDL